MIRREKAVRSRQSKGGRFVLGTAFCILLTACFMFLNGCGSKGKIAAVVNGHVITVAGLP
jgi:hypothetical protein